MTSVEPDVPATRRNLGDPHRAALEADARSAVNLVRRVPAHAEEIAGIRSAVLAFAEMRGITKAARDDIVLAVCEACTNVVVHAYIDAAVPGSLTVTSAYVSDELVVTVRDEGRGMLPRAESPGLGLGLSIIGRLASQAEFGPNGASGTEVRMTFAAATEQP